MPWLHKASLAVDDFWNRQHASVLPQMTPKAIRDALIDEERVDLERAYRRTMIEAARTLDLTPVLDILRDFHHIAVMTQHQGPEAHRRMLDQAEHALRTGEAPEGSVSGEVMMARLNERLGRQA